MDTKELSTLLTIIVNKGGCLSIIMHCQREEQAVKYMQLVSRSWK